MTDTDLLVSGITVFVMALIGLVLTVLEFRKMKPADRSGAVPLAARRAGSTYVRES